MRQNLQAARPGDQLGIDVIDPPPAAVAPSSGTIAFRISGANLSFVDPAGAGLPQEAISRVQLNVNGQVISVDDVQWQQTGVGLEGRLDYGDTDAGGRVMLRPGPAAVVIAVADGYGVLSAQQAWHFVVASTPGIELVVVPVWFPIAAGLTTPVPQLEQHGPVLGGPHRRLEAADLPVPEVTIKRPGRRAGTSANRRAWAQARPGVRVDEHREPDLPAGYLHLDRLSDEAAAWCAPDGRFGLVEWKGQRIHPWATELDQPAQLLRAAGDVIAIGTAAEARCFDAGTGELLWSASLAKGRRRLLDATSEFMVVADAECVIASLPESGEALVAPDVGPPGRRTGEPRPARRNRAGLREGPRARNRRRAVASTDVRRGHRRRWPPPRPGPRPHLTRLFPGRFGGNEAQDCAALARPAPPAVRILDGTLVATVTGAGEVVLLDLTGAVEADRTAPVPRPVERAWIAGPFMITIPPLSVAHLWGGISTAIPLDVDPSTGALEAGSAQALVRGADRSAWLEFS